MAAALVLSGGTGARRGTAVPKQYIKICDRFVISFCIEVLAGHDGINSIQIVAAQQWQELISEIIEKYDNAGKFRGFSDPGKNRQLSIYNGLKDIRSYTDDSGVVLIHDAARPLLSGQQVTDCLAAMDGHDGVLPALPMKDTVYFSGDGMRISSLLERNRVFAGQAPELFVLGKYYEANYRACGDGGDGYCHDTGG